MVNLKNFWGSESESDATPTKTTPSRIKPFEKSQPLAYLVPKEQAASFCSSLSNNNVLAKKMSMEELQEARVTGKAKYHSECAMSRNSSTFNKRTRKQHKCLGLTKEARVDQSNEMPEVMMATQHTRLVSSRLSPPAQKKMGGSSSIIPERPSRDIGEVRISGDIVWWPDRFYLNNLDPPPGKEAAAAAAPPLARAPGARPWEQRFSLPHLLDHFLGRGELRAVVLASYGVGLPALRRRCPKLFDASVGVPTLVLHGEKKAMIKCDRTSTHYLLRKEKKDKEDLEGHEFNWQLELPRFFEVFRVLPVEKRPAAGADPGGGGGGGNGGGGAWQRVMGGCHHPKYALLFTADALVAAVTTGNLVAQRTLDATWCQRFPRQRRDRGERKVPQRSDNNFGEQLEDFLQQQTNHMLHSTLVPTFVQCLIQEGGAEEVNNLRKNTPRAFLCRHLGLGGSGDDDGGGGGGPGWLAGAYDFSATAVDLITTVPGRFPLGGGGRAAAAVGEGEGRYGHPAVRRALRRRRGRLARPPNEKDILIIQPTSMGPNKDDDTKNDFLGFLGHVANSFVPPENRLSSVFDKTGPEFMRIYWPEKSFVKECTQSNEPTNACFLTSEQFNKMNSDVHDNLHMYHPRSGESVLPHNKAYIRLHSSAPTAEDNYSKVFPTDRPCSEFVFQWYLLTSANLSEGALGTVKDMEGSLVLECKGFELGVLFHSSFVPDEEGKTLVLAAAPCRVCAAYYGPAEQGPPAAAAAATTAATLVRLPVPLCLQPDPYYDPEADAWHGKMYFNKQDRAARKMTTPLYNKKLPNHSLCRKRQWNTNASDERDQLAPAKKGLSFPHMTNL